jgi:hypothetical protein
MLRAYAITGVLVVCVSATPARAQTPTESQLQPPTQSIIQSEDTEPRVIGRPGTMLVGFSGYVDRFFSPEAVLPINYLAQVDVCRFITKRFAVRVGAVGTGSFGGDNEDELASGSGAPSVHASGGVLFYFTPESMISFYLGGEYWAQLTQRAGRDTGSLLGTGGIHAAISSRASLFIQGGVGARVARGEDDELFTRFVAQLGLRIKL